MRWRFDWGADAVLPAREVILRGQGLPEEVALAPRIAALLDEACEVFVAQAEPRGLVSRVDAGGFEVLYAGEGRNDADTPLDYVYRQAGALALFVVTLGERVTRAIDRLFEERHPARAWMLDAVASEAADGLAHAAGRRWLDGLRAAGDAAPADRVLPYSPGYCGWHVSGQRALFASLRPAEIGVTLNASYLMEPLKSVSGVLVAGPPAIHQFDQRFPCCESCATRHCQDRMLSVLQA